MKHLALLILLSGFFMNSVRAQVVNTGMLDTTGGEHIGKIVVGAYIDAYYGYNFSKPASGDIPYVVSMSRSNEANINLAYVDVRYNASRLRGRLVPGFGTYMNANYTNESGSLKNIVEATIGVKPFDKKDIWVDFGVLGSPYTNESAISRDHLMYTRSLSAENVPYYLAGAKITAPVNKKLTSYLYLLNGWQQIKDLNSKKSVGFQLEYRPHLKNLINFDLLIGDERSSVSPLYRTRYLFDLYWIHNPDGKLSITSCAYIGLQQVRDTLSGGMDYHQWWQANFIARYRISKITSLSGRIEYYSDPNNIIVNTITPVKGYSTFSTGLCLNVKLFDHALYRIEGRYFFAEKNIYLNANSKAVNQNLWFVNSLTLWF